MTESSSSFVADMLASSVNVNLPLVAESSIMDERWFGSALVQRCLQHGFIEKTAAKA